MGHDFSADYKRLDFLEEENKRLQSKLEERSNQLAEMAYRCKAALDERDSLASRLSSIRLEIEKEARGEQSGEYTLTRLVLLTKPSDVERQNTK